MKLTPRQTNVMMEVIQGSTLKETAYHLQLARTTVAKHVEQIKKRLGARSLPHAVALLLQDGDFK